MKMPATTKKAVTGTPNSADSTDFTTVTQNNELRVDSTAMTGIITRTYQGHEVTYNIDGWINATLEAEKHGKRLDKWFEAEGTKEYIATLCEMTHTPKTGYVKTSKARSDRGGGTWLHPKLAVNFARWLDVRFAIWCDEQIDNIIRGKDNWRIKRHAAASSSKVMSALLDEFRATIGKETANYHHMNEHKLVNSLMTGEYKGLDREALTTHQLDFLAHFEVRNTIFIGMGMTYEQRKGALKIEAMGWQQRLASPSIEVLQ